MGERWQNDSPVEIPHAGAVLVLHILRSRERGFRALESVGMDSCAMDCKTLVSSRAQSFEQRGHSRVRWAILFSCHLGSSTCHQAHAGITSLALGGNGTEKPDRVRRDKPACCRGRKPGQPESLSERKYLMGDSPSSAGPAQKAFSCGEHRGDILRAANWPYPAVTGFQLGVSAIRCRKSFSKL